MQYFQLAQEAVNLPAIAGEEEIESAAGSPAKHHAICGICRVGWLTA